MVFEINNLIRESHFLKVCGSSSLKGEVKISGAKNSALVLMAASLLANEMIELKNVPQLTDVEKMEHILKSLGVKIDAQLDSRIIDSRNIHQGQLPYELVHGLRASFFCIGPLLARFGEASLALPGGCKIGQRPINEHIKGLEALGSEIKIENDIVYAKIKKNNPRLTGTQIKLNCPSVGATETLIMAASLAEGTTIIENAAREPEIQDLCQFLNQMGAKIYGSGQSKIIIYGVDKLKGCSHKVIPDRIEAGTFLIAAAATLSEITISPVIPSHLDSVLEKLRESGSEIYIDDNKITICTKTIRGVDIETAPYPGFPTDLQAPFMSLMTIASGNSTITENIFENRMGHVISLNKMGASIKLENNIASIDGVQSLNGCSNLIGSDLRSSAAVVIAALSAEGTSYIGGLEHLDRGYEKFELKLNKLGALIKRELIIKNSTDLKDIEISNIDQINNTAAA